MIAKLNLNVTQSIWKQI